MRVQGREGERRRLRRTPRGALAAARYPLRPPSREAASQGEPPLPSPSHPLTALAHSHTLHDPPRSSHENLFFLHAGHVSVVKRGHREGDGRRRRGWWLVAGGWRTRMQTTRRPPWPAEDTERAPRWGISRVSITVRKLGDFPARRGPCVLALWLLEPPCHRLSDGKVLRRRGRGPIGLLPHSGQHAAQRAPQAAQGVD